jgi:hypothetical protein
MDLRVVMEGSAFTMMVGASTPVSQAVPGCVDSPPRASCITACCVLCVACFLLRAVCALCVCCVLVLRAACSFLPP